MIRIVAGVAFLAHTSLGALQLPRAPDVVTPQSAHDLTSGPLNVKPNTRNAPTSSKTTKTITNSSKSIRTMQIFSLHKLLFACLVFCLGLFGTNGSDCPAGKYSRFVAANSSSTCTVCPSNYYSESGASNCIYCVERDWCDDGVCRQGHTGKYCRLCEDGRFMLRNLCEECPSKGFLVAWAVIVSAMAVAFSYLLYS